MFRIPEVDVIVFLGNIHHQIAILHGHRIEKERAFSISYNLLWNDNKNERIMTEK